MKKTFAVKLKGGGKLGRVPFAELPFDMREVWGKARVPVKGTINGFPFRTTVVVMRGSQCFCVNADMRKGSGADVGDVAKFVLEPDLEKRTVEIPEQLKKSLGVKLSRKLESLAFTHQKEFVKWYVEAKQDATRDRRVAKIKEMLTTGKIDT